MVTKARSAKIEPVDQRRQPRFTAQFRSTFSGGQREGQGKTIDLSDGGCKIESNQTVIIGGTFEYRIYVPGLSWPIRIDEAQVRWVNGKIFGVQFISIQAEERQKLKQLLINLETEQVQESCRRH